MRINKVSSENEKKRYIFSNPRSFGNRTTQPRRSSSGIIAPPPLFTRGSLNMYKKRISLDQLNLHHHKTHSSFLNTKTWIQIPSATKSTSSWTKTYEICSQNITSKGLKKLHFKLECSPYISSIYAIFVQFSIFPYRKIYLESESFPSCIFHFSSYIHQSDTRIHFSTELLLWLQIFTS